ncbi:terminase large subunit [Sinorhizobium meliloti]|uniref:terminase large subunit n=1 Tax=Rhizobium meliloti TaxID=382 RepID=UPI000FE0CEF0|nr:terminase large subunit [Sinorhizobium meliloti]RVL53946.1 terminase large subunit [Sinorhizobium meliloti]
MDTAWMPASTWSTAVPDWKDRIRNKRSLIPDLPLYDAVAAKALRIFKRLRVPDIIGNPTYGEACDEWVFDFVRVVFGSYDPETKRRALREFFLLVPKKNGKSSIAAAIIVTAAILNERPEAELLLIAPTKQIAEIAFKQAAGIIRLDPALAKLFHPQDHVKKITHLNTLAVIQIKAAAAETITGSKATYILIDETHVFSTMAKASDIFVEIRGSLAARPDGFLLQITTQSKTPPSGVFKSELQKARDVRDGIFEFPMLSVLYELPPEDAVNGGWKRRETWGLVNPNLNRSVDEDYLAGEIATAEREGPEKLALIASQHFNVEVGLGLHADRWAGAVYWEAAVGKNLTLDRIMSESDVCVVGIDGGGLDDLMAIAVIGRQAKTRTWLHWSRAWAYPDVFERRKEIAPRLRDFEKDGDLVVCERADQDIIEITDVCERLFVAGLLPEKAGIGLDAFGVASLLDALAERGMAGDLTMAVGQGWKLQSAVTTLPRKLKDRTLRHCGQPLMAWAVGNAKTELRGSNYIVTKQAAGASKIDPLMALFNAGMLMFLNPEASGGGMDDYFNSLAGAA